MRVRRVNEVAQQLAATRGKAPGDRALEINFAIEAHEELDCIHARIIRVQIAAVMDVFIGEVLDGLAEDFKRATGLRCNVPDACRRSPDNGWKARLTVAE